MKKNNIPPNNKMAPSPNMERRLREVAQEKQRRKNELGVELMDQNIMPNHRFSTLWKLGAERAYRHCPPVGCQQPLSQFRKAAQAVIDRMEIITFAQFQIFSNCLECVSQDDLNLSPIQYKELLDEAVDHIHFFNAEMNKLNDEVDLQVSKEFSASNVLHSVKAEA